MCIRDRWRGSRIEYSSLGVQRIVVGPEPAEALVHGSQVGPERLTRRLEHDTIHLDAIRGWSARSRAMFARKAVAAALAEVEKRPSRLVARCCFAVIVHLHDKTPFKERDTSLAEDIDQVSWEYFIAHIVQKVPVS